MKRLAAVVAVLVVATMAAGGTAAQPLSELTEAQAVETFNAEYPGLSFIACSVFPTPADSFMCYGWRYDEVSGLDNHMIVAAVVGLHVDGYIVIGQHFEALAGDEIFGTNPPVTIPSVTAAAATTMPAGPATTFGDGNWLVGADVLPGIYQATAPEGCYWQTSSDLTGDDIVNNEFVDVPGTYFAEILPTDVLFHSDGCGTWTPAS